MQPLLSLSGVSKRFDNGTQAIARLDIDVADGEFVSLVGPSGCGKSTALRIIAGLLTPDGGSVTFPGEKPQIGFVFQEPTLMPWGSALTNVRLPLDLEGMNRSQADDRAAPRHQARRAWRLREGVSARAFRRHEDARLDRTRHRRRAEASFDGRTVRGA